MAAAHRETILTGKKAGGTSRYAKKLAIFRLSPCEVIYDSTAGSEMIFARSSPPSPPRVSRA